LGVLPATRVLRGRPGWVGLCQSRAGGVEGRQEAGSGGVGEQEDPVAAVGGADVGRA